MTVFNSRLPALQAINLKLDRSAAKPLSKSIRQKQAQAQSLFGFDKSNIVDYNCKALAYSTGFENAEVQRFYIFYKKASRDQVLKFSVKPFQIMTSTAAAWNYPHSLYVDINEIVTYTLPGDLLWASTANSRTVWFKSDDAATGRLVDPSSASETPVSYEDFLNVSSWTTNNIYCFEVVVKCYDITAANNLPNIIGLAQIHVDVMPEEQARYITETGVGENTLFVGSELVATREDASLDSGIVQVVGEIAKVKNSSFDHTQALFQDLLGPNISTAEAGSETYLVPQENAAFGSPLTIPLLTLNTPRFQKGSTGGSKTFQFCMKYIAPTTEPANHVFELEYRVREKDTETIVQTWTSLQIFNVPDNATIFTGDFSLPATAAGYNMNACIVDFRILTSDTLYPFTVQTVSIIEKEYT